VTLRRQILLIVLALIIAFVLAQGVPSFAQPSSRSAATGGQEGGNQGGEKSTAHTQEAPTALSSLSINASSPIKIDAPIELLVTGPNGQQTGFDVVTGTIVQNIPHSSYGTDSIEDDVDPTMDPTPEVKSFEAGWPISGNYILQVLGTGTAPYTVDILAYDSTGALSQQTITGKATPGIGTVYQVRYSSVAGSQVSKTFIRNIYTITATAASGGTISPSGAVVVNSGTNQTFTISPDMGYSVASVTVDGVSKGATTRYTFTNITAPYTIAVTFANSTAKPLDP
jgi:uncharacterized protein YdeI (BOF family)